MTRTAASEISRSHYEVRIIPSSRIRQVTPINNLPGKSTEEQDDGSDNGQSVPPASFMPAPLPPGYGYQRPPPVSNPGGFPFSPPLPMMPPFQGGVFPPMMSQPYGYAALPSPGKSYESSQTCAVHLPFFPQPFEVPFPSRKLPVCLRCKKNFRSRELCRQRDEHKALPWQTVYAVITLTDDVLEKGEDGKLSVANIPVIAELQETPEMCRGPGDGFMATQPICKICKEKNYTRDYCRGASKHTTPPYQAVYVKLVPKPDSSDIVRAYKKKKRKPEENADGRPIPDPENPVTEAEEAKSDDLSEIHPSRTILAEISSRKFAVKVGRDSNRSF